MRSILSLTKRNFLVFLRDKTGVFFSLLSPLIVLVLFILFLGDTYKSNIVSMFDEYAIIAFGDDLINTLIYSWLIAGVIGVGCITVSFSAISTMISDRENGINKDYIASPIGKVKVYISYILGVFVITTVIMLIVTIVGIIFLLATKCFDVSFINIISIIATLIVGSLNASLFVVLLTLFIKSQGAHGAFTGIICAISGFLIGAYMPLASFPKPIQSICAILPGTHTAVLFKNEFLANSLNKVGEISIEAKEELVDVFSTKLELFGNSLNSNGMWIYLIASTVIFSILTIIFIKKSKLVK